MTVNKKTIVKTDYFVKQFMDGIQVMIEFLEKGPAHKVSVTLYDHDISLTM